jgi:hypothetical protein
MRTLSFCLDAVVGLVKDVLKQRGRAVSSGAIQLPSDGVVG